MRDRIAYAEIWRLAREQAIVASPQPAHVTARLPERCPILIDELLANRIETSALVERISGEGPAG
jgi:hypothetical protein